MMDAYSFHASAESLDATYEDMRKAYLRAFARLGLTAFAVEADTGAIGGTGSHEFMVAAEVGEDAIIYNPQSGYAANVERAAGIIPKAGPWQAPATAQLTATPKVGSIADVMGFLNANGFADVKAEHGLKCVLLVVTVKTDKGEKGIRTIYGMTGEESIPVLAAAVAQLGGDVHPDYWEPTEGNARNALLDLLALARLRPEGVWDGD